MKTFTERQEMVSKDGKGLRLLVVGLSYGSGMSRYAELERLSGEIRLFDFSLYLTRVSIWRQRLETLTFVGPGTIRANRALIAVCKEYRPEVIWLEKSSWVWPSTMRALRKLGIFLVHHFTDGLFPRHRRAYWSYTLVRRTLPLFDLNITSNIDDHRWMLSKGISSSLTALGYDPARFDNRPLSPELQAKWASDIQFVGHHEPRSERMVVALADAGLPVRVFGHRWPRAKQAARLGNVIQHQSLNDEDYVLALKATKIGLCFISELNYNQTAGRSFELTALGVFLLAWRTQEHMDAFIEGEEAEFFSDGEELVRKARYYLEHPEERARIAQRGHERCLRSDYSWYRYTQESWAEIVGMLNARRAGKPAPVRAAASVRA